MDEVTTKPKQVLLGLYRKEIWDNYEFTIVALFAFDRFFNWALSEQMAFIEIDNNRLFLIDYKTIAPSWGMTTFYLKKIMLHLSGSLPKGTSTNLKYPLIRVTKQNPNHKWYSYFGFEKGVMNTIISWETINPERRKYLEGFVNSNGLFSSKDLIALNPPKQDNNKIICKLFLSVEAILIELYKINITDKKRLFSFPQLKDHFVHTDSIHRFQKAVQNIYLGGFEDIYIIDNGFKEKNAHYISKESYKKIKECKNNWDKVQELIILSAKNYLTWFEEGREPLNKTWLPRDIGTWMFDPMKHGSMFLISILYGSTPLREKAAENTFNRLPTYIQNQFIEFYKDEWDGLTYWNKIYSVYKWYKDNADDLIKENNNYRYWLDGGIADFMQGYYDFMNAQLGTKYLKHFGTKCATWNWFVNEKKENHEIEE